MASFQQKLMAVFSTIVVSALLPVFILIALFEVIFKGRQNSLEGMTAVVTGAGNGLGKEMALQLGRKKCTVLCVDMRKGDAEATASMIEKENIGRGRAYVCDITDVPKVEAMRDSILEEFGKVDLLVNNAAFVYTSGLEEGREEHIRRCVDVNILGTTWMTRAFLPSMKREKKGRILFINSVAGFFSERSVPLYSMTKAAVSSLAAALRDELDDNPDWKNIIVSSAHPWFIDTNPGYKHMYKCNMDILTPSFTAESALNGVRRGFFEFSIPLGVVGAKILLLSLRIFPRNYGRLAKKMLGVEFKKFDDHSLYDRFISPDCSPIEVVEEMATHIKEQRSK